MNQSSPRWAAGHRWRAIETELQLMPHGIRNDRRPTERERLRVCESIYETAEIFGHLIEPRTEKRTWHCPPSNGQQGQRWTPNHLLLVFLLLMDDVTLLTPIPLFNKRFHRPPPPFPLLLVQAVFSLLSAIRVLCVTRSIVSISDWLKNGQNSNDRWRSCILSSTSCRRHHQHQHDEEPLVSSRPWPTSIKSQPERRHQNSWKSFRLLRRRKRQGKTNGDTHTRHCLLAYQFIPNVFLKKKKRNKLNKMKEKNRKL